jgi:hypothetical protein
MELTFTIVAGLGALLVLIGYLGFVFAGFKHHFVTGIISALPVLNIVTVPALWRNAGSKVIISIVGLAIVIASWFLGANTGIQKYIGMLKGEKQTSQTTITSMPVTGTTTISATPSSSTQIAPAAMPSIDESNMLQLPKKALYRMHFEIIPIDQVQSLKDKVVKIITTKGDQLEGRVNSVTASSIVIQNNELPIANIKQISLMVKKAN